MFEGVVGKEGIQEATLQHFVTGKFNIQTSLNISEPNATDYSCHIGYFRLTCRPTLLHCKLKSIVARITTPCSTQFPRNKFLFCKLKKIVAKSRTRVYFAQHIAATLKFVAWKVEHVVVIRTTTLFNLHATVLGGNLNENVGRFQITWP